MNKYVDKVKNIWYNISIINDIERFGKDMTIEQAVKVANLLGELDAIDALRGEIELFLSNEGFEYLPIELSKNLVALIDKAYEDKKKEIESL